MAKDMPKIGARRFGDLGSPDREHKRLVELQQHFLPQSFPEIEGIEWAARYHPSKLVGGDYYDVFPMQNSCYGVVMADISGHGYSAAIVMSMTQFAVKEFAPACASPSEALKIINDKLQKHMLPHHFVTMFFGMLNPEKKTLTYSSAGHIPMLHFQSSSNCARSLDIQPSYPLCTFPVGEYPEARCQLDKGDGCLFFTDGVLDAPNVSDVFYGEHQLLQTLEAFSGSSAQHVVDAVYASVEEHRGNADRLDDFTLLSMRIQ
ncbi:MAG: PP2C family protein-serine/threonine phosphatase [Candidatus Hinthialibacter antarcticus]|nr:PP2C family protein-serine/threonine phosphatase [Candidatus Hinthialibacter antarcticus]